MSLFRFDAEKFGEETEALLRFDIHLKYYKQGYYIWDGARDTPTEKRID